MKLADLQNVRFGADGLVPVVAQDADTGEVLMLAYMNTEALLRTQATGRAHYWSRSRSKLWRKGETSGNEQLVEEIRVNCEQNSLLLRVRQIGAVCHEGYATCFFRALNDDGSLTVVRERVFDPKTVYGTNGEVTTSRGSLTEATRLQYGAYVFLRHNDLSKDSNTSRRLHDRVTRLGPRVADELRELAGVLRGEHSHTDFASDVRLEASQVAYWVYLMAVQHNVDWSELRPDRALATADVLLPSATVAKLLGQEADSWDSATRPGEILAAAAHATLALTAQACRAAGVDPFDVVRADLTELRARPYLAPYFAQA